MSVIEPSVVYRIGKLTERDYDEAIEALINAKAQLVSMSDGGNQPGCRVCEDSGHTAGHCHHNPLVVARQRADDENTWRCYHCGFIARTSEDAVSHFGRTERDQPSCRRTTETV